jgi:IMP dehydrogenase
VNQDIPRGFSFDDVLLIPQYSTVESRSDIDLSTQISPNIKLNIPLISTKMDTVTGVEMAINLGKLGGMGILPRWETVDIQADKISKVKREKVVVAAAIGIKEGFMERAEALVKAGVDAIDIDVAHGHLQKTIDATAAIKQKFGNKITLISGITSTYECASDLYKAGADMVLVGVGGGATCLTRIVTGCGVPCITALLDTARAAQKYHKTFAPDAGIRNSGDIVKALATGASAIVSGFIFSGTDEAPGKVFEINGKRYKEYSGSASHRQKIIQSQKDPSDKNATYTIHVEGIEGKVPCKGPLNDVVEDLLAGVRSGFSYCGAHDLQELWQKAKFIRVTTLGSRENGAHNIVEDL